MEKGIERLAEAAVVAAEQSDHIITLEITPSGVRARITWTVGHPGRQYSEENLTTWRQLHPRPDTRNPLLSSLDALVQARTNFVP